MTSATAARAEPEAGSATTVLLVEDHDDMREVLAEFLSLASDVRVVGAVATAEAAMEALRDVTPDLLVVDVSLPGMSGLDLIEAVAERWPELRCLVVSGHGQREHVDRALEAGARGYVLKGAPYELPEAVRRVVSGEIFLSRRLQGR